MTTNNSSEFKSYGCRVVSHDEKLTFSNRSFSYSVNGEYEIQLENDDLKGLSEPFVKIVAKSGECTREFRMWQELPLVEEVDPVESKPLISLQGEHWEITAIKLATLTDITDSLKLECTYHYFNQKIPDAPGNIFFLKNIQTGEAIVLIAKTPDYIQPVLRIQNTVVSLDTHGCGYVIGFCKANECERLCRDYYRHLCKPTGLYTMSNTWGDFNGWKRVKHDFILREIDVAAELGLDIVQIDDGWQTGSTADPTLRDERNHRMFVGDFWKLHTERFPHGIKPISEYAAQRGIRTGLWFAPDSRHDFKLLERDIAVLKKAYDEWDIRYFKLDMIHVETDLAKEKMLELLNTVYSFGNDVSVELDVTNGRRLGYYCGAQYGSIFEENRYTFSGNSFPHRVLRNLWNFASIIPTCKFQFEFVNPDLNTEKYAEDDPFAPVHFDMDYLFATTAFSNPLFWMEMQYLTEQRKRELMRVMPVWKQHAKALGSADVTPIGERPSGRSMTGLCAETEDAVYLMLFREVTDREYHTFTLPCSKLNALECLASNCNASASLNENTVTVHFGKARGYAFLRFQKN